MKRAYESGKPWGVGEACNAYYGTPEQVSNAAKDGGRAYRSFEGRMESVAVDAYNSLANQRKYNASYRSVFNLIWYGLQPLPLGLKDQTKAPTLKDGIAFTSFVEGKREFNRNVSDHTAQLLIRVTTRLCLYIKLGRCSMQ